MSLINAFTVGAGEGIGALLCGWINSRYGLTVLMDSSVEISAVFHCMYSDHVSCVKRDSWQNNKKQLIYDERKVW